MMRSYSNLLLILADAVEVYAGQVDQAETPAHNNSDFR